jgi:hypothetical protein
MLFNIVEHPKHLCNFTSGRVYKLMRDCIVLMTAL